MMQGFNIRKKYIILDEEINPIDYLNRSVDFLEKIDEDRLYLKWFTIAFHGAVSSFIIMKLSKINSQQIFIDSKTNLHPKERRLVDLKSAYKLLKSKASMDGNQYKTNGKQDACINELIDQLRNQLIHFKPMVWAAEPWYFAESCLPLVDIIRFCIDDYKFRNFEKSKINQKLEELEKLLKKYITI